MADSTLAKSSGKRFRAYPNNYSLSPVILNGAQRSEESPLRWPDSSASPQNDKGRL